MAALSLADAPMTVVHFGHKNGEDWPKVASGSQLTSLDVGDPTCFEIANEVATSTLVDPRLAGLYS